MTGEKTAYKKKLIEVVIPLEAINEACTKKGIHAKMHTWWARRPLIACIATLFFSIVDDPSNYLNEKEARRERKKIFSLFTKFINDLDEKKYVDEIRGLIKKQNPTNNYVLDPFCGGGTIPLSAHYLGLKSLGIDLNPVAVLVSKSLVELPTLCEGKKPLSKAKQKGLSAETNGLSGLIQDLTFYGNELIGNSKSEYENNYGKYPLIDYLIWARTVKCTNPACQTRYPLLKSNIISQKNGTTIEIIQNVDKSFSTRIAKTKNLNDALGTIQSNGSICPFCKSPISFKGLRQILSKRETDDSPIFAVTLSGKIKKYSSGEDISVLKPVENHPSLSLPDKALGFRIQNYGMTDFSDLFNARQLLIHTILCQELQRIKKQLLNNFPESRAYVSSLITYLSFVIDKIIENNNKHTRWRSDSESFEGIFSKQTISMSWDYVEINVFNEFQYYLEQICDVLQSIPVGNGAIIQLDSAASLDFLEKKQVLVSTDPPYYDNVGYADLSDFFYMWLRVNLKDIYPDLFSTICTPKKQEIVANPHLFNDDKLAAKEHFTIQMNKVLKNIKNKESGLYPLTIHYAFKQMETENEQLSSTGWETMLSSLIEVGYQIVGTWPMRTETRGRMREIGSNALASSIVLVCRIRSLEASISTRREFVNALKKELPSALKNIQSAGIAPVDIAQSAIGPGMTVFSRYSKVLEADGNPMSVRTALQIINQELDAYFTEQESDMDKETRFCIAWYEQYSWKDGPFGDANTLATAKGTAVNALEQAGVIYAKAGKVRLLKRTELDGEWDPASDNRLTVWECAQQLIKALEDKGEDGAAKILKKMGGLSEPVKELAYRLYALCEKRGWTEDGLAYNNLISSWQSITDKAQFGPSISESTKKNLKDKEQKKLFEL